MRGTPTVNRVFRWLLIVGQVFFVACAVQAQGMRELNGGWVCKKASDVGVSGVVLSVPGYSVSGWMPATVPGTVLTTLVNNKVYPDPFFGMNLKQIPDIYATGLAFYTYWFVLDFDDTLHLTGNHEWLNLRGINYSFSAWVNGHEITPAVAKGMFLRHSIDITQYLAAGGKNRLAVVVYPSDPVGNPNGGQGGDGTIARSVTNQFVAGWDWIPAIPDRNTGIWDEVTLHQTGPVRMIDPQVQTVVKGARDPAARKQGPATIKVSATLENNANGPFNGTLTFTIDGHTAKKAVTIAAHKSIHVSLPDVVLANPKLWWPNGFGSQPLYDTKLELTQALGGVSDRADIKVGVRSIKGRWNSHTKSREVQVNGRRIFLKGGNWIASDALLRLSAKRYDAEVRLHHDMNLNLIRVWGGGLTERPEFYDACDKYGILVMQDFWVSGDCNGRWYDPYKKDDTLARRKYPDDHALFVATLADQICLLRNHASLAIWCGGNELKPPADILKKLRDSLLPKLDGTSIFFAYSNDDSMSLNSHDGPYDIQNPDSFFYRRSYPFNSEVGSVGLSDVASLRKIMPMKDLVPPYYNTKTCKWVTDSVWAYHKYKTYDSAIERYGHPSGIEAFCGKAQLVNYTQYRALMEGVAVHGWDWYTGVIEWKTQNPWPALLGQMYDPWLDPNGCWAGIKKGAEDLHVLFDPTDSAIVLVNRQAEEAARLQVSYQLLDMTGHRIAGSSRFATVKEGMNDTCFRLANLLKTDCPVKGCFMALRVVDSALGFPVDENLYWLADSGGTYSGLQEMPEANIRFGFKILEPGLAEVTLTNPEKNPVAFFNRISLVNPATLERILPTFFSDNYVSVLPGTTRTVLVTYDHDAALTPKACVEGWNVRRQYAKSR